MITDDIGVAKICAAKNAHIEDWKWAALVSAIQAVQQASHIVPDYPPALRPVAVAQFLLESNWGKADMGVNNFFGLKARGGQSFITKTTHEYVHGRYIEVQARFAVFGTMQSCFEAHGHLLATAGAYAKARECWDDPMGFAAALTGVYATDPDYGKKLQNVMVSRGLLETFGYSLAAAP